jgi:hypothetical protein
MRMSTPPFACLGALALELRPDAHAALAALDPAHAAELAEGIARTEGEDAAIVGSAIDTARRT